MAIVNVIYALLILGCQEISCSFCPLNSDAHISAQTKILNQNKYQSLSGGWKLSYMLCLIQKQALK